ncbi:butyrate kinase [Candidatus Riflebacteria bacterium]
MDERFFILTINPGSTSTKIAVFENEKQLFSHSIKHAIEEVEKFKEITDQYEFRKKVIESTLKDNGFSKKKLHAIVARGGPLKPLVSGTYIINEKMVDDLRYRPAARHISNLAAIIAFEMVKEYSIPCYIVDPVSVDEFEPLARLTGIPELERVSLGHALNIKAVAREAAKQLQKKLNDLNLIIAHLGSGISICPLKKGKMIDVNNANESGPMAAERAGALPASSLVKLCFSGKFTKEELLSKITKKGGLAGHLGTTDLAEVERRITATDKKAKLVFETMAYQIAKEIGAMATVLKGQIDAIVITGGMAHSKLLLSLIGERIGFISKMLVIPGENELKALALGGYRVLTGQESARDYV